MYKMETDNLMNENLMQIAPKLEVFVLLSDLKSKIYFKFFRAIWVYFWAIASSIRKPNSNILISLDQNGYLFVWTL